MNPGDPKIFFNPELLTEEIYTSPLRKVSSLDKSVGEILIVIEANLGKGA